MEATEPDVIPSQLDAGRYATTAELHYFSDLLGRAIDGDKTVLADLPNHLGLFRGAIDEALLWRNIEARRQIADAQEREKAAEQAKAAEQPAPPPALESSTPQDPA